MRRIFVDTGAWDAIADRSDKNHKAALRFRDEIAGKSRLVSTNYILDELYTLLLMNVGFHKTLEFKSHIDVLIRENILEIIWITEGALPVSESERTKPGRCTLVGIRQRHSEVSKTMEVWEFRAFL